jgi:hypothetical protein
MMVLREYEDFYNSHRPHRALDQAAPRDRCQMASPTWIISGSGGMTARVRHPRISPDGIGFRHLQLPEDLRKASTRSAARRVRTNLAQLGSAAKGGESAEFPACL